MEGPMTAIELLDINFQHIDKEIRLQGSDTIYYNAGQHRNTSNIVLYSYDEEKGWCERTVAPDALVWLV